MPPSSEVIGTTSIIVTSTESATSARIKIVPGGLIKGQPGSYLVPGSSGDTVCASKRSLARGLDALVGRSRLRTGDGPSPCVKLSSGGKYARLPIKPVSQV